MGEHKGKRELRCIAVYVSTGIDLRLLERGEIRRTALFTLSVVLLGTARRWHRALLETGWNAGEPTDGGSPLAETTMTHG